MKILVVFTGGTIGSSVSEDGYFAPDSKKAYRLIALYKKYQADISGESVQCAENGLPCAEKDLQRTVEEVVFDTVEPYTTLSENLELEHLALLTDCLRENLKKEYDGIIVTHGSDTLQYTAAALGYIFGNDTIPIMLVASNYILEDARANGLDNFAAAVSFICQRGGRGVFVSYKNTGECAKYHRGTRLQAHPAHTDYLESVDNLYYGSLKEDKVVKNPSYVEREDEVSCFKICPSGSGNPFGGNVLWLQAHPGMMLPKPAADVKAILITSYHSGTINTASEHWRGYFKTAADSGVSVFLVGASKGMSYESTKAYREMGIQALPKMAPIAAYMKLLLCALGDLDFENNMGKSLGGDLL